MEKEGNPTRNGMFGVRTACGPVIAIKVSMVGSISVGKTSLATKFCRGDVCPNPKATVAGDWLHHSITVLNRHVNLQIWDTAGQERYRSVIPSYIRASAAVIIVYDVTDVKSFTDRRLWLKMVKDVVPEAYVMVVANKVDATQRVISTEDGSIFAAENELGYMETSAMTGHNVETLFYSIAERVVTNWNGDKNTEKEDHIKLRSDFKRKQKCKC